MKKQTQIMLMVAAVLVVIAALIVLLTPLRSSLAWRIESTRARVFYWLNPPEEVVFKPRQAAAETVATPVPTQPAIPTSTVAVSPDVVTLTPPPTATPIPTQAALSGIRYTDQHGLWNYCAPATLTMGLSFWGWNGTREDAGQWLKPFEKDKNVMLYEMEAFATEQAGLSAVLRSGGTPELIKALIAGGFPVILEKGTYIRETTTGKVSWMGHYSVLTGYDDLTAEWITQDSYYSADYRIKYDELLKEWRAFNYAFLVIYSPDRQSALDAILGPYSDANYSYQQALEMAAADLNTQQSVDLFFSWFNRGTSLMQLQDYTGAAGAYDQAFQLYPDIEKDLRPWRIMWYQTGPYFAYFYTGRYQDLVDLATTTIEAASEPFIEESFYWRARAYEALGNRDGAIADLRTSLEYHPNFGPSTTFMQQLGISN